MVTLLKVLMLLMGYALQTATIQAIPSWRPAVVNMQEQYQDMMQKRQKVELKELGYILQQNNAQPFTISKAWYGEKKGKKLYSNDAKEIMQKYASKGIFLVPDNMNGIFGDPLKGTKKKLHVVFEMGGKTYVVNIPEHVGNRGAYTLPPKEGDKVFFVTALDESLFTAPTQETTEATTTEQTNLTLMPIEPKPIDFSAIKAVKLQELGALLKENDAQPFTVSDAWYGEKKGQKLFSYPAQEIMQKYASKGIFLVPDNMNSIFKDPIVGTKKRLHVTFNMNNQKYTIDIPEHMKDRGQYSLPQPEASKVFFLPALDNGILNNPSINPATSTAQEEEPIEDATPATTEETKAVTEEGDSQITNPDGTKETGTVVTESTFPPSGVITREQLNEILPANDQKPFTIVEAWYGTSDNNAKSRKSVTDTLQKHADKGILMIPEQMGSFFNIKGKKEGWGKKSRSLYIKFQMQGNTYEITIPDEGKLGQLPKKVGNKWFTQVVKKDLELDAAILAGLSFEERSKNIFELIHFLEKNSTNHEMDPAKKSRALEILAQEVEYIFANHNEANDKHKDMLVKLVKMLRKIYFDYDPSKLDGVKALAEKYNISIQVADALLYLKQNAFWQSPDQGQRFVQVVQNIAALNQQGKLAADEITDLMSIIQAAQTLNVNDQFKGQVSALKTTYGGLTVPAEVAPEEPVNPVITNPEIVVEKASDTTYDARLQKLVDMKALASAADKEAFFTLVEELVRDRAYASAEQMQTLLNLVLYYMNVATYFAKDSEEYKRLEKVEQDLRSGITYESRLLAAKSIIDKDSLVEDDKEELFNILSALAQEQGKANVVELGTARGHLYVLQKLFKDEEDQERLKAIEVTFNAPPAEVKPAEEQQQETNTTVEPVKTEEEQEKEAVADQVAQKTIDTAVTAATSGATVETAEQLSYKDQVLKGFTQLLATRMNPTPEALEQSYAMLKKLVDNRALGSADDVTTLNMLLKHTSNIQSQEFLDKIKPLTEAMGISLDFAGQLQYFNNLIIRPDFATNQQLQSSAITLIERIITNIPQDITIDAMSDLKASLIAASSMFTNEADKQKIQALKAQAKMPVEEEKPLQEETTKSAESMQESVLTRIAGLKITLDLTQPANRAAVLTQLDSIMKDRPRASAGSIDILKEFLQALVAKTEMSEHKILLQEYIAALERPATILENIDELDEIAAFEQLQDFHSVEVIRILNALKAQLGTFDEASLTRLKALLLKLTPKISQEHKIAFDMFKAIFEAPMQVIAPKAATESGAAIPEAVTDSQTAEEVKATEGTTPEVSATDAIVATATQTLSASDMRRLDMYKRQLARLTPEDRRYQSIMDKITAIEQSAQAAAQPTTTAQGAASVAAPTSAQASAPTRSLSGRSGTRSRMPSRSRTAPGTQVSIGSVAPTASTEVAATTEATAMAPATATRGVARPGTTTRGSFRTSMRPARTRAIARTAPTAPVAQGTEAVATTEPATTADTTAQTPAPTTRSSLGLRPQYSTVRSNAGAVQPRTTAPTTSRVMPRTFTPRTRTAQ